MTPWRSRGGRRPVFPAVLRLSAFLLALSLHPAASRALELPPPQLLPGYPMVAGDNVLIGWMPVPGAARYTVSVDGKPALTVEGTFAFLPLPGGSGEFRIEVAAVAASGETGRTSSPRILRLRKAEPPRNVSARPGAKPGTADLMWDPVPGALSYNVYRSQEGSEPRLLKTTDQSVFRDATVEPGISYSYAVSGLDLSEKEGPRSAPVRLRLRKEEAPAERPGKAAEIRAVRIPVQELLSIPEILRKPVDELSHLKAERGGGIRVVLPGARETHLLGPGGDVRSTIGPGQFDAAGFRFIPHKADLGPDGNLYVTDFRNSALASFGPGGTLRWVLRVKAPPETDSGAWEGFPAYMRTLPPTPSAVLCLEKEIWVTDQRFQVFYRFGYGGEALGYETHYTRGDARWRFRNIGEIERLPGDRFLFTFPLVRKALVLDRELRVAYDIGGDFRKSPAAFLGLHGASLLGDGRILLTDPELGTMKVYDAEAGGYLHEFGEPSGARPNMAAADPAGNVWVYLSGERRIAVLRPERGEGKP